jgi:LmbE family N-acetylglucosaminyl deacetylase
MKILCVSAHPDDMEIGCAGTLLTLKNQGHDVTSLITVRPSTEVNVCRTQQIVESELEHSQHISQFRSVIFDTELHNNGRPNLEFNNITMSKLDRLIPYVDLAIVPNIEDSHQEHKITHNLVLPILRKKAKKMWAMHSWPYCYYYNSAPTLIRDISSVWDKKLSMLRCYSSYVDQQAIDQITVTNQYWAHRANLQLAEAFTVLHDHAQS